MYEVDEVGCNVVSLDRADIWYDPLSIDEDNTFVLRPQLPSF